MKKASITATRRISKKISDLSLYPNSLGDSMTRSSAESTASHCSELTKEPHFTKHARRPALAQDSFEEILPQIMTELNAEA